VIEDDAMEFDAVEEAPPRLKLRDYQERGVEAVEAGWPQFGRQLLDVCTGGGKTEIACALMKRRHERDKGRTLFLAHRENLVIQSAKRIADRTGLKVGVEMASQYAPPSCDIVVGSVQSLQNPSRLMGFKESHFAQVIADESHHSLSDSWQRVLNYFHFGKRSLDPNWGIPDVDVRVPYFADLLGITATPDISGKKKLGHFYQRLAFRFSYLDAVEQGWLVPPVAKSVPLEIDIRGLSAKRTDHGADLGDAELAAKLIPIIGALADQLAKLAMDRKTIAYVPSVQCAKLLAEEVTKRGMDGQFVSGECEDKQEKLEHFSQFGGRGSVLTNCSLVVEGTDVPSVDCIAAFRATQSAAFYRQFCGRACRPLKGLVDHLETAAERRAAIAASRKSAFLILDPCWITDRIQLCSPFTLVTSKPESAEMAKGKKGSLIEAGKEAERDLIQALAKEAKKHAHKDARTINPLDWAMNLGSVDLAAYEPETDWEAAPPMEGQLALIGKSGIDVSAVTSRGMASKLLDMILDRTRDGKCTPEQMSFLIRLGMKPEDAARTPKRQAGAIIGRKRAEWAARRRAT